MKKKKRYPKKKKNHSLILKGLSVCQTMEKSEFVTILMDFIRFRGYPIREVKGWNVLNVVKRLLNRLNISDGEEVTHFTNVVNLFLLRQKWKFQKGYEFVQLFNKIEKAIEINDDKWIKVDCFRCLSNLLAKHVESLGRFFKRGKIFSLLEFSTSVLESCEETELVRYVVSCMISLLKCKVAGKFDNFKGIHDSLLGGFHRVYNGIVERKSERVVMKLVLECLSQLVLVDRGSSPCYLSPQLEIVPAISELKVLAFLGTKVVPVKNVKKVKKKFVHYVYSSGSDSDCESSFYVGDKESTEVRKASMTLLANFCSVNVKSFFKSYMVLFPGANELHESDEKVQKPSLCSLLEFEKLKKGRISIMKFFIAFLMKGRSFFSKANEKTMTTSFVTFSQYIASVLKDILYMCSNELKRTVDKDVYLKCLVLKCLGEFFNGCPYDKLDISGKFVELLTNLSIFLEKWKEKDPKLVANALFCLSKMFLRPSPPCREYLSRDGKVLASLLLRIFSEDTKFVQIRNNSGYSLANLAKNYESQTIQHCWDSFIETIRGVVKSEIEGSVKVVAMQVVSRLVREKKISSNQWLLLFRGILINCHTEQDHLVLGMALTVYSFLDESIFFELPEEVRKIIIGFVESSVRNEIVSVRCSALKTLRVFNSFRSLANGRHFVQTNFEFFTTLIKNPEPAVRMKASMAFANLCASLQDVKWVQKDEEFLLSVFEIILSIKDEKMLFSSVRALGYLFCISSEDTLSLKIGKKDGLFFRKGKDLTVLDAIIEVLSDSLKRGNVKVKWNCCFSLGTLLQSEKVHDKEKTRIVSLLCEEVVSADNFKVRIQSLKSVNVLNPAFFEIHEKVSFSILNSIYFCYQGFEKLLVLQNLRYKQDLVEVMSNVFSKIVEVFFENGTKVVELCIEKPKVTIELLKMTMKKRAESLSITKKFSDICKYFVESISEAYDVEKEDFVGELYSLKLYFVSD